MISRLQQKGVETVAVQNPLTSLNDDVAAVNRAIASAKGPVVLVGHSWGGAVITQAGGDPKVKALVYVAAFAPDVGMSVNDLRGARRRRPACKEVVASPSGFLTITKKEIMGRLRPRSSQVKIGCSCRNAGSHRRRQTHRRRLAYKPSWYVVSKQDHMIAPDGERAMAKAIKAHVSEVDASHVSMLSKPDAITAVILEAVKTLPK